jgi:hypothetical protein
VAELGLVLTPGLVGLVEGPLVGGGEVLEDVGEIAVESGWD